MAYTAHDGGHTAMCEGSLGVQRTTIDISTGVSQTVQPVATIGSHSIHPLKGFFGFFFFFSFLFFFRVTPTAYGGSQARGPIRAVATDLHHSHTNSRSEPHLRPTPQLTATPEP